MFVCVRVFMCACLHLCVRLCVYNNAMRVYQDKNEVTSGIFLRPLSQAWKVVWAAAPISTAKTWAVLSTAAATAAAAAELSTAAAAVATRATWT